MHEIAASQHLRRTLERSYGCPRSAEPHKSALRLLTGETSVERLPMQHGSVAKPHPGLFDQAAAGGGFAPRALPAPPRPMRRGQNIRGRLRAAVGYGQRLVRWGLGEILRDRDRVRFD